MSNLILRKTMDNKGTRHVFFPHMWKICGLCEEFAFLFGKPWELLRKKFFSGFKIYYKSAIIQIVWYWQDYKQNSKIIKYT